MPTKKIYNKGQATIFTNKYLEALTKSHPAIIYAIYLPIIGFLLYYATRESGMLGKQVTLLFFSGLLSWTIFEYVAHRFAFHPQSKNPVVLRIAYVLHGNHHEFPKDKQRIIMPPVPSLLLSGSIFACMYLVAGNSAFAFFPGFIMGYLLYSGLHYAIHAMAPPFPWLKPLWRNHQLHHYKNENMGFGVSSLLWDRVFGTTFDLTVNKEDPVKVKELMHDK